MVKPSATTSRSLPALLLGLAATVLALAGHWAGLDLPSELRALDLRFRTLPCGAVDRDILNVNIDDESLQCIGRWPWPREELAGLVTVLADCNARLIALDIILPDPQKVRYESDAVDAHSDYTGPLLGAMNATAIFDDMLLADTLRRLRGRVYLPMFFRPTAQPQTPLERQLGQRLATRPAAGSAALRQELLADANSGCEPKLIESEDFPLVYLRARAWQTFQDRLAAEIRVTDYPLRAGAMIPPTVLFAEAAQAGGFVTFEPDADGVVRRIPLLASSGGKVIPQFALSIAADWSAQTQMRATADGVDLLGPGSDGNRAAGRPVNHIPVDGAGRMLIHWTRPPRDDDASRQIPAWQVGMVWQLRKDLRKLGRIWRLSHLELAQLVFGADANVSAEQLLQRHPIFSLYAQADETNQKLQASRRARLQAMLFDPEHIPPAPESLLAADRQTEERIEACSGELRSELSKPENLEFYLPGRPDLVRRAQAKLADINAIPAQRQEVEEDIQSRMARLRPLVENRLCLVGSTATGAADFVPTPMETRSPGVMVHTNIINTILTGSYIREAGGWANSVAIVLAGLAVSWLAARRPVWQAGLGTVALAGGYVALAFGVVFGRWNVWLVVTAPLAAMFLSLLVVTGFRQLTEERAKRRIRGLFAHALSPALVDKLIEDPSLARLGGERRVLSCFFSDLEGFTPLAGRLGEQATVRLLNQYFDRMTDVVQNRNGGYLNKFLGDGLFVFFGAPVLQNDRAARAVQAALDCQAALVDFNRSLRAELGIDAQLACRVGVATGEVMVGNCGSTHRMDYTAIGDTVNLASRLEGANKFFGTRVLVDDQTWRQAGMADIVARPMGRIVVVGRDEPVTVWNPLGATGSVPPADRDAAATFADAVGLFGQRQFVRASERMQEVLRARPADKAAQVYWGLCQRFSVDPPGAEWNGAVRLTEK